MLEIPYPCPNAEYERIMGAFVAEQAAAGIEAMAFGDLFLEDIRRYREGKLAGTGIAPLFPLWGIDTRRLAREMIAGGLEAYVTCVDPRKLPASFAGRRFDAALLADLPAGVDPCAENGEFHTFACAGPMFRSRRSRSRPARSSPATASCSAISCPLRRSPAQIGRAPA